MWSNLHWAYLTRHAWPDSETPDSCLEYQWQSTHSQVFLPHFRSRGILHVMRHVQITLARKSLTCFSKHVKGPSTLFSWMKKVILSHAWRHTLEIGMTYNLPCNKTDLQNLHGRVDCHWYSTSLPGSQKLDMHAVLWPHQKVILLCRMSNNTMQLQDHTMFSLILWLPTCDDGRVMDWSANGEVPA